MTSAWESTNVPNLCFAGTLIPARDFKRSSSAFIDGFRYNIRTLHRLMEACHGTTRLQGSRVESTAAPLSTNSFEWGSWTGDVLAIERHPGSETAEQSAFLHPVIRRFEGDRQLRVRPVLEDLFGTYGSGGDGDVVMVRQGSTIEQYHACEHRLPLQRFFQSELDGLGAPPT